MYSLKYTERTFGVQSWREITSGGTRTKWLNTTAVILYEITDISQENVASVLRDEKLANKITQQEARDTALLSAVSRCFYRIYWSQFQVGNEWPREGALGPDVYSTSNRNEYKKQNNYVSGE
jgi:hypothetical protein